MSKENDYKLMLQNIAQVARSRLELDRHKDGEQLFYKLGFIEVLASALIEPKAEVKPEESYSEKNSSS